MFKNCSESVAVEMMDSQVLLQKVGLYDTAGSVYTTGMYVSGMI